MTPVSITLKQLAGRHAIARQPPDSPIPDWADGAGFLSISRTEDELSVVCREERVPVDVRQDRGWTCFKFQGPFAFSETGIALAVIRPLSEKGVGIFLVSTFDTDYLLIKTADVERSRLFLSEAGHVLF
ncbi:ACT domain-containing protein [Neorhizobium sp. CSC1952]|uniref:ACT domain-containing protein n=1 Tax=Neorhizobium sp. CSC1952 TaxID=2978974 RepID=UPI0025A54DF9|nr:ACT domain-containing protein [Rhizobium sp. CSC1952]WJR69534.1 ACT domain-containing protein [Rhizobium sp. CSC1952]